jgi:hypothetical protein
MPEKLHRVYSLSDPRDGRVRYVGVTVLSLRERVGNHVRHARAGVGTPKDDWVRALLALSLTPVATLIEETPERLRECDVIARFRAEGHDLLNRTAGGDSTSGPTRRRKPRQPRPKREPVPRGPMPAESREKIAASKRGKPRPLEVRAKLSAALIGRSTGRKATHCPRGHEYNPENARINVRGAPECRICERERYREKRAKHVAASGRGVASGGAT